MPIRMNMLVTSSYTYLFLSLVMRKPDFCISKNKDADQLCSKCTADQRLYFRYMDSTILLVKSVILKF